MSLASCVTRLVALCAFSSLASAACAAPLLFDFGPAGSQIAQGFTGVDEHVAYGNQASSGWRSVAGLESASNPLPALAAAPSSVPPPIWTNPITADSISSAGPNDFCIQAPPGEYTIYLVCGTSLPAARNQYYDFTVQAGNGPALGVQIEGPYQYRTVRLHAVAPAAGPLVIHFTPHTRWVCNAIMVWTPADAATVESKIIPSFEAETFRLPAKEALKWVRDPEPSGGPMPEPTPQEMARGFAVYSRHCLTPIYPGDRPARSEMDPTLKVFAAQGQIEASNFVVLPLCDLMGARVTVSAIGPLALGAVEVRHVRFMEARPNYDEFGHSRIVPDLLERFDSLSLRRGENARFWLTFRVGEAAPPGDYTGTITFECAGGKAVVPVQLKILPIHLLEDPGRLFGIYYNHPLDRAFNAKDEGSRAYFCRKADLEHRDMAEHGVHNTVLSMWAPPADAQGRFEFHWELLEEKLALWKKYNFRGPIIMEINTSGVYEKYTGEELPSHLRGLHATPPAFEAEIASMVRTMEAERKRRAWPEFIYYVFDEPCTEPASVSLTLTALRACKSVGVRTYLTADPTLVAFKPLQPFVDVWCTQPFRPDRETVLADTHARGVEYWCYPNHISGENDHTPVAGARMTYGFGFWRSGFRALIPWIYSSTVGDPMNYLDGPTMDFFNRSEPDGAPIPPVLWEAYREGHDDYSYIYTLQLAISRARSSPLPRGKEVADAAAAVLRQIECQIQVQPKYQYTGLWKPQEFDEYRWQIALQIMRIQAESRDQGRFVRL